MKDVIARERPEGALFIETTYSYPSGHATVSVACALFLAYVCSKHIRHPQLRILCIVALTTTALLIAFSRLYLGVHYPSDVLVGTVICVAWAFTGIVVVRSKALSGLR